VLNDLRQQLEALRNDRRHKKLQTTWECAQDAAESLDLLYQDLLTELQTNLQNAHQLPAEIRQDPLDLVELGYWVVLVALVPLIATRATVRNIDGITYLTPQDLEYMRHTTNIRGNLLQIEALLYGMQMAQVYNAPAHIALQRRMNLWLRPDRLVAANIPALGFMELLIRVKAQTCNNLSRSPRPQLAGCTVH
jgi:hypothetical protein